VDHANDTFLDVEFVDASHGWAVGWDGILATSNGGATWSAQLTGDWGLNAVSFADASHGWAVGFYGAILATSNGGATWGVQTSSGESLYGVSFADASHGWAVGSGGILATTDGGANWVAQTADTGNRSVTFNDVQFTDASHGWAVGDYLPYSWWFGPRVDGTIFATGDGGATWTEQNSDGAWGLRGVAFNDSSHGWAVGEDGTILATTNGGWSPTPTPTPTVTPKVTLKLSGLRSGAMKLGRRVTAEGTVTPTSLVGIKVRLTVQKKRGATWVKVKTATATIRATSAYSWMYKATTKGAYRVRVTMARTATSAAAKTPWRTFRVK
jgi:photosystem II stability/assembly factor-like uncharacterized protein